MRIGKFIVAAAASSLMVAPVVAAPTVKVAKVKTTAVQANEIEGSSAIVAVVAAVAVGVGIYLVVDDNDDSN